MRTIVVSTPLEAPAEVVWRAVNTPQAFVHVAAGMLRYPAAERVGRPWRVGDRIRGWTLLFGVVPFSYHHLTVASIDDDARVLTSDEHGGVVRAWRHDLTVAAVDATSCHYEDRIEIECRRAHAAGRRLRLGLLPVPPASLASARPGARRHLLVARADLPSPTLRP